MRTNNASSPTGQNPDQDVAPLLRRAALRYLPVLFIAYIFSIIDRVNVGFAKLQMQQDLHFSDVVYGLGAGIFFIGYFLFEVPSNMMLARVGARRWIARIMIMWGPIAAAFAFVQTPTQFYVLRFLLGLAEAGLFPGVLLMLTYWFPDSQRTRYIAMFMLGLPIAGVIIGPMSAAIISGMDGLSGMAGWQWMFIVQGLPALGLGLFALAWLDDTPAKARWLTAGEKAVYLRAVGDPSGHLVPWRQELKIAFSQKGIAMPTVAAFFLVATAASFGLWGPQFLQDIMATDLEGIGLTFATIFLLGTVAMLVFGALADRMRRETLLLALLVTGAASFAVAAGSIANTAVATVALGIGGVCYLASFPIFWGYVTPKLAPAAAAATIAIINSIANLGGAFGPTIIGPIKQDGGLAPAIVAVAVYMALAALAALSMSRRYRNVLPQVAKA
ncbi:MFS transporter [Marinobacter sp.]|uniref:MFS transporter n=1 Tax=Marinobacter sp. TaxID=50741 RepID=UPI003568ABB0